MDTIYQFSALEIVLFSLLIGSIFGGLFVAAMLCIVNAGSAQKEIQHEESRFGVNEFHDRAARRLHPAGSSRQAGDTKDSANPY